MNEPILSSPTIERCLLGSILLDNDVFHEASASLQESDLYLSSHRVIFAGIARMIERGAVCDGSTLPEELRRTNELESVGGWAYISELTNDVPRRPPIADYVRTLREKSARRSLGQLGENLVGYSLDSDLDADGILDAAEGRMLEIRAGRDSEDVASTEQGVAELLCQMEDERARTTELLGLPSGIPALDRMTRGYQVGELTVVGAASGVGKTSLMVQAAIANAGQGVPVLLFSLEMTKTQLLRRILCAVSGVPFQRVRDARWASPEDLDRIKQAALRVAEWPLHIEDASGLTIERLTAKARLAIRRHGVRLVGVDYIQIVSSTGRDERLRVSSISRGLTRLAKDERVPVLALSQLARPERSAAKRPPTMTDLRESSQIENDSHCIVLIHRERDEEDRLLPEGQLRIAKQRNGTTGAILVRYSGQTLTFEASEATRCPLQPAARPLFQREGA